jgi:tRNA dimethylallyltransferase
MLRIELTAEELREKRPIVVLAGPTAVGKSAVAVRLAKMLDTDVLTADSRQVYRDMDIGTDKPSMAERQGVAHELIDLVRPDEAFNAGLFRRHALAQVERLYADRRIPLVVGGTGLYIRVLLHGLWPGPAADPLLRQRLEREAHDHSGGYLHGKLAAVDPVLAARLHPHDEVKIIRALEVHALSGQPLSEAHWQHAFRESPFTALLIGLIRDRDALYARIEARVEGQLQRGLLSETRWLLNCGYGPDLGSMKGLGYRQMVGYLTGQYSYEEAVRVLKRDTRHFAKRQLTWFRKEPDMTWLSIPDSEPAERTAARVLALIQGLIRATGPRTASTAGVESCQPLS